MPCNCFCDWCICPESCLPHGLVEAIPKDYIEPAMIGGEMTTFTDPVNPGFDVGGWPKSSETCQADCNAQHGRAVAQMPVKGISSAEFIYVSSVMRIKSSFLHSNGVFGKLAIPTGGLKVCRVWGDGPSTVGYYREPWFFKDEFEKLVTPAHVVGSVRPSVAIPSSKNGMQLHYQWDIRVIFHPSDIGGFAPCAHSSIFKAIELGCATSKTVGFVPISSYTFAGGTLQLPWVPLDTEDQIAGFIVRVPEEVSYGACGGMNLAGTRVPLSMYIVTPNYIQPQFSVYVFGIRYSYR